ncbi:MAG: peptidoglycan DD-metalloendopeptidase family protein [Lachnospiraceae bacterium]|nr:peptidoglycan DD-metalloendopeptidase family protein [Lachnospiraceae bacterium]
MNRRTWKDFLTNRSTIWTLSLCLVGAIVLGGMAAVNSSRNSNNTQPETELGQIAYLEEDLNEGNGADGSIQTDISLTDGLEDSADASSSLADGSGDSTDVGSSLADGSGDSANMESSSNTVGSIDEDSVDTADTGGTTTTSTSDTSGSDFAADANTSDVSGSDVAAGTDTFGVSGSDVAADTDTSGSSGTNGTSDNTGTSDDVSLAADASGTEEASSSSIISEQALIEAGVSFTDGQSVLWPCAGTVVIDYSMDKSVYFSTLNQYKYNPALIISSDSGNQVLASAKGIVESISIDEETGTTLVLNIGNGYKLTYGQLMEPAVSEGDVVEAGDLLAYISEPTKYYSTEGSNLYFAMTKDGEPVDPVLYLE